MKDFEYNLRFLIEQQMQSLSGLLGAKYHELPTSDRFPSLYRRYELNGVEYDATLEACVEPVCKDWGRFSYGITTTDGSDADDSSLPTELQEVCKGFEDKRTNRWYFYKYEVMPSIVQSYLHFVEQIESISNIKIIN